MDATCAMLIKSHEQVLNIIVEDKSAVHMLNVAGGWGRGGGRGRGGGGGGAGAGCPRVIN